MRPKLAFVLFSYFPYGGLQRDFLAILQACLSRGAEIKVFAMQWRGERPRGVEVDVHPGRGWTRVGRRRGFARHVRDSAAREGFDAVVGFNRMPGLDYYYAADSCFAAKALDQRAPLYRLLPRSRQYLRWERAVFDRTGASRVFMLSPPQAEQYRRHYQVDPRRVIALPPGIDPGRRADETAPRLRASLREEFGISPRQQVILQLGSGFAVKGVDRSLRAIAALPRSWRGRVRYLLVGQDRPRRYQRLARKLGIEELFTVVPGRDDIPRFLQGADLLLHPARSESAGMVLLEAVVAGLPVLCTDTCGYAFHVCRARAGLVCESPFSQAALNSLLREMLASEHLPLWRRNGIAYGRREDLYHLADHVADHLCAVGKSGR